MIAAVSLGRDHLHATQLRDDVEWSRAHTDLIAKDDTGAYAIRYLHTDALGTPVATSTENGKIAERRLHDPYGGALTLATRQTVSYTGHVQDGATGLTYMEQRYYDASIGRFLSVDPVTADSNTGNNFNRYWYANNNPYRFTDPDGRLSLEDSPCQVDAMCSFKEGIERAVRSMPANIKAIGQDVKEGVKEGAKIAVGDINRIASQVDVKVEAGAANIGGGSFEGSLVTGATETSVFAGEGAAIAVTLQPRESFKFGPEPPSDPAGAIKASFGGGAGPFAGVEIKVHQNNAVEVTPKLGAGAGALLQVTPEYVIHSSK